MAQILKTTKAKKIQIEDVEFCGVSQNLSDTSKPTTRKLSVTFKRKNGTEISFRLFKEEVAFITNQINSFEENKNNFYCYNECVSNAAENFDFKKCKEQCEKCVLKNKL